MLLLSGCETTNSRDRDRSFLPKRLECDEPTIEKRAEKYRNAGFSPEEAEKKAKQWAYEQAFFRGMSAKSQDLDFSRGRYLYD